MIRFYAERFVSVAEWMQRLETTWETLRKAGLQQHRHTIKDMRLDDQGRGTIEDLVGIVEELEEIGLPLSAAHAKRMQSAVRNENTTLEEFARMAGELRVRLDDELAAQLFLHVPSERAKYFAEPDFDPSIATAFPDATLDIEEAAKCFALGRWTACVFHLMRTTEHGMRSLAAFLGLPFDFKNWDPIIKKMRSEVDNYNASSFKGNLDFLRQTLERLTAVQVALRNEVMHSRSFYDEERTFYESDCQGRFSSSLIAFWSFPLQSAHSDPKGTTGGLSGWAEQSYAADSYRCSPEVLSRRLQATC